MPSNASDTASPGLPQKPSEVTGARILTMGEPLTERSSLQFEPESIDFPRRVLLVEPAPGERTRLRNVLISGQFEVSTASDVITAFHTLAMFQPNAVLAQMRVPPHGGIELLRCIKEHGSTRSIPVILYGGIATAEQRITALNLGATDLISEPFVNAELIARLRASLRARHKLSILEERARLDSLTGLANRGVLEDHLLREWNACRRRGVPLAVVILDLDFFKTINDTYGHPSGDEVLRQTAKILVQSVRSSDLVARYGGEEFVIVAADCPLEAAVTMAQRFRANLQERTISVSGIEIAVTASAGIALADWTHQTKAEDLLCQADVALYRAKESGRNAVWVHYGPAYAGPAKTIVSAFPQVESG